MKKISGKVTNSKGVATINLQPDLSRINAAIEPKFGLTVVSGTFNVVMSHVFLPKLNHVFLPHDITN